MTEPIEQHCSYFVKLYVDCDMLYVHIGRVHSPITLGMYVSHAATPSVRLDFVLPYLESHMQTIRCLAAETFARQTLVCSHGMKRQPGKGRNNLEHVFPHHLWFRLFVYPTWCGIVCLIREW